MSIFSDNPKRAGRITQVASQAGVLIDDVFKADANLAKKGKYVAQLFDEVLKKSGFTDGEAYLKHCAETMDPEHKQAFLNMVANEKATSSRIAFITVIVGQFGANYAWKKFNLPAQMGWGELWNLVKIAGAETKNSVIWMARNPNGFVAQPPPNEKMFVIEEVPEVLEEELELSWLARVRGQIEVGAGSRFLRSLGCTIIGIGIGIAVDELVQWCLKSSYVGAEGEVCISRLSARYAVDTFDALNNLISEMEVISELEKAADAIPDAASKISLLAVIDSKKAEVAVSGGKALEAVSWGTSWEFLRAKDKKDLAYITDDLPKDEMIKQTQDAVDKQAASPPQQST
ncbi:hypothetical protein KCU73_g5759, partial [Aureobasidium melanogenum]